MTAIHPALFPARCLGLCWVDHPRRWKRNVRATFNSKIRRHGWRLVDARGLTLADVTTLPVIDRAHASADALFADVVGLLKNDGRNLTFWVMKTPPTGVDVMTTHFLLS